MQLLVALNQLSIIDFSLILHSAIDFHHPQSYVKGWQGSVFSLRVNLIRRLYSGIFHALCLAALHNRCSLSAKLACKSYSLELLGIELGCFESVVATEQIDQVPRVRHHKSFGFIGQRAINVPYFDFAFERRGNQNLEIKNPYIVVFLRQIVIRSR